MPSTLISFEPNRPKEIVRRYEGNPILTAADAVQCVAFSTIRELLTVCRNV